MQSGYNFEVVVKSAYRMAQAGDWNAASNQFRLASSISNLTDNERLFIINACDCARDRDLERLSDLYVLNIESRAKEGVFHYLKLHFKMTLRLIKSYAAWFVGLWVLVVIFAKFWYNSLTVLDIIVSVGILILSTFLLALIVLVFRISTIDAVVEIGMLVVTSIITSIVWLLKFLLDKHK